MACVFKSCYSMHKLVFFLRRHQRQTNLISGLGISVGPPCSILHKVSVLKLSGFALTVLSRLHLIGSLMLLNETILSTLHDILSGFD